MDSNLSQSILEIGLSYSLKEVNIHGIIIRVCNQVFFFLNKFLSFIYLFLAVFGLCCCTRAFSRCGERGLLFIVVRGLLTAVASLVVVHGL